MRERTDTERLNWLAEKLDAPWDQIFDKGKWMVELINTYSDEIGRTTFPWEWFRLVIDERMDKEARRG